MRHLFIACELGQLCIMPIYRDLRDISAGSNASPLQRSPPINPAKPPTIIDATFLIKAQTAINIPMSTIIARIDNNSTVNLASVGVVYAALNSALRPAVGISAIVPSWGMRG